MLIISMRVLSDSQSECEKKNPLRRRRHALLEVGREEARPARTPPQRIKRLLLHHAGPGLARAERRSGTTPPHSHDTSGMFRRGASFITHTMHQEEYTLRRTGVAELVER